MLQYDRHEQSGYNASATTPTGVTTGFRWEQTTLPSKRGVDYTPLTSPLLHDWEEHRLQLETRRKYLEMKRLLKEVLVEEEGKEDLDESIETVQTILTERMTLQDTRLDRLFALMTSKMGGMPTIEQPVHETHDPVVLDYLKRVEDPTIRKSLDTLVKELRTKYSRVQSLLNKMDVNRDGVLSKSEMGSAMVKLGVQLSSDDLDGLMATFDPSGDGKINLSEFSAILAQHQISRYH